MTTLLAIDPGEFTGLCVLRHCPAMNDIRYMFHALVDPRELTWDMGVDRVVIERPQVYQRGKSKVDPNDLITLALRAGAYEEWARVTFKIKPEFVKPAEWKGQVGKSVTCNRVLRRFPDLDLSKYPESKVHNVTDAIGIGLWALTGEK